MAFEELGVSKPILKALAYEGYERPTPIQEQAIPVLLQGRDLLGCAQTGTGKTAAFAIPIIQLLSDNPPPKASRRKIRALVVTPTRELALQIGDSFKAYAHHTPIRNTVIFGGVKQGAQTKALSRGVDVLVATPGRLLDLMGQGFISLREVEYLVLDEADHMLDMGFIHDIRRIVERLPERRQSLFFSATMPSEIVKLSKSILGNPFRITIKPEQTTAERVKQQIYFVSKPNKRKLLVHLLETIPYYSVLVFSRTKHGADKIARVLNKAGVKADAIHGNKTQNSRQRVLNKFKDGKVHVLVATDIAARGIDVDNLSHVINYDLPNVPETYVHRIGRTGRAEASGIAISFCQQDERPYLKDIQKLIRQQIEVIEEHPFNQDEETPPAGGKSTSNKPSKQSNKQKPKRAKPSKPAAKAPGSEEKPEKRKESKTERQSDRRRDDNRDRRSSSHSRSNRSGENRGGKRRRENHFPYLKEMEGWEEFESPTMKSTEDKGPSKKKRSTADRKKKARQKARKHRPKNGGSQNNSAGAKKKHRKNAPPKNKGQRTSNQ